MQYIIPDYYQKFSCIAGDCPDTCCARWQIVIDDKAMKKYRKLKSPFAVRLRNGIDAKEGVFRQYKGRCEFLNEQNLCDIYSEAGEDMLCKTCKRYPRHIEEFEGLREISLSISCPEVARILLNQEEKVHFIEKERETKEEEFEDFDYMLFTNLCDAREYVIEILQTREESIHVRMAKSLAYVHDVQTALCKGEQYRFQEITERHRKTGFSEKFHQKWETHAGNVDNTGTIIEEMWKTLLPEFEVLKKEWTGFVQESLEMLYGDGEAEYKKVIRNFEDFWKDWEIEAEQLLVYWVFTYFCGAVYDGDVFTKMKMAVAATLFIRDLDAACLKKKEDFTKEDQIEICYRYSRELEHSDLNLNKMEELLAEKEIFKLDSLLCAIASGREPESGILSETD